MKKGILIIVLLFVNILQISLFAQDNPSSQKVRLKINKNENGVITQVDTLFEANLSSDVEAFLKKIGINELDLPPHDSLLIEKEERILLNGEDKKLEKKIITKNELKIKHLDDKKFDDINISISNWKNESNNLEVNDLMLNLNEEKGILQLSFNLTEKQPIKVAIRALSGRPFLNVGVNDFNGEFNTETSLTPANKGAYRLTIEQNGIKNTYKVVIE